jgi:hypothetical protein
MPHQDRRSIADIATDHRRTMDKLYREIAEEQSNAWRKG